MQVAQPSIYRSHCILGLVDDELNESLYKSWGKSLARMMPARASLLVTSDHRKDSESYKAALTEGLRSGGINVIDLGRIPTNLAAYGINLMSCVGCVSVTGQNHSPAWNGLRWLLIDCPLSFAEQIDQLRREAEQPPAEPQTSVRGDYRTDDLASVWQNWLCDVWYDAPKIPMKVIVDPMYGNWAPLARQTLAKCYPMITFESIHDEPRADFGEMIPASRCRKSLVPLCNEVVKRHADLGVAFDADAGYFSIIDDQGKPLFSEEFSWVVIHHLLGVAMKDEIFLHDVNCSEKIIEEGIRLGAKPILVQNTNNLFVAKMRETKALIGFSFDGGLFFRGVCGNRIVIFAVCWFIDFFTRLKTPLSKWRKQFPVFPTTSEIRTPLVALDDVIQRLSKVWSSSPTLTLEGVRFVVGDGRVHVRSIPDFAQLGFHFEADHQTSLRRIVLECCEALDGLEHTSYFLKEGFRIDS